MIASLIPTILLSPQCVFLSEADIITKIILAKFLKHLQFITLVQT